MTDRLPVWPVEHANSDVRARPGLGGAWRGRIGGSIPTPVFESAMICETKQPLDRYGMETNNNFIDLLRLLADSLEHPDPDRSPLSNITDLGDQAVPLLIEALTHDDPIIRRTAAETLGQLRFPVDNGLDLQPAIPHLETMMASDPDTLVRLHAAEAHLDHH